ncbi:MAG: hypothetical protein KA712_09110 [Myxococcales bacterium]|nr:hypothetical protein [Myxococcales bacterium]
MSEHITHVAVFEDAARLALLSPAVHPHLKQALRSAWPVGVLGSVTRLGDQHTLPVLAPLRQGFTAPVLPARTLRLLAFTLGWRAHNAADRQWKPVYRYLQPEHYVPKQPGVSDVTIYHDVAVFKEVYAHGRRAPMTPGTLAFGPSLPGPQASLPTLALEPLFGLMWQRELLRLQSFAGQDSVSQRFAKAKSVFEPLEVDPARYAEAYHRPDPVRVQKYLVAPNFYDADEPLLVLLERLRQGGAAAPDALLKSRRPPPRSQYAEAVTRALVYTEACSDYLCGTIDDDVLTDRCDLLRPHKPPEVAEFLRQYEKARSTKTGGEE